MATPKETGFAFDGVWLRSLRFEDPTPPPRPGTAITPRPVRINLTAIVELTDGDARASVKLRIVLEPTNAADKSIFEASLEGVFRALDDEGKKKLGEFARVQGPALLIPFIRELVANTTARCATGPLLLPPINVYNLALGGEREKVEEKAAP
jgi:preprotein translocase subunit SecB